MRLCLTVFIFLNFVTNPLIGQPEIPEYASILSKYITYPSIDKNEREAGMFLLKECEKRGLVTDVLIDHDTAFNFVASLYPLSSNKPNLIFLNHIDVVPPGDTSLWQFHPYCGAIKDSIIYGRGSIDNKGMAVAALIAISSFVEMAKEKELSFNISLLSVSGEETGGIRGAKWISETQLEKLNPFLILGEGGSGVQNIISSNPKQIVFGISTVEKTKLTLELDLVINASGHGAVPPHQYAMKEMVVALGRVLSTKPDIRYSKVTAKGLKDLGKHEKGLKGFVQRHFTFFFFKPIIKREIRKNPMLTAIFSNTITLTQIETKNPAENQITQSIKATLDCRLLPGVHPKKFIRELQSTLDDKRIIIHTKESTESPRTYHPQYFKRLEEAIKEVYPKAEVIEILFPASSDNAFFRTKDKIVLGIFPACFTQEELESIHSINEQIHFERMESSIKIYTLYIEKLLGLKKIKIKD